MKLKLTLIQNTEMTKQNGNNCFCLHTEYNAEADPAHLNLMGCRLRVCK